MVVQRGEGMFMDASCNRLGSAFVEVGDGCRGGGKEWSWMQRPRVVV